MIPWVAQSARSISSGAEMEVASIRVANAILVAIAQTARMRPVAVSFSLVLFLHKLCTWLNGAARKLILRRLPAHHTNNRVPSTNILLLGPIGSAPTSRATWSTLSRCRPTEFACDQSRCIELTQRCDNFYDCNDLTDELSCTGSGLFSPSSRRLFF